MEIDSSRLPTITQRYLAILIDGFLVVTVFFLATYLYREESSKAGAIKGIITFGFWFLYVPIFISCFCTLGQFVMGVRIRTMNNEKLNVFKSFIRFVTKLLLGFISFFTVLFNENKRAIHDYAAGSIALIASKVRENP